MVLDSICVRLIDLRSDPGTMKQGKVPKRIHKAEREKMKREHLNELFLDLANALGNFLCLCYFSLVASLCSNFTVYLLAPFNMTVMFYIYFVLLYHI